MAYIKTELTDQIYYYVWGNTPPVCLTQDLPPERDADILLLGCGDARHVLFTCFADDTRKIDVTCCDIEPGIHARNVLLYTLLMEENANLNIERIWDIYYHWKINKASKELLETQTEKLLKVSESIDEWHGSVYGSRIRFCDARSLFLVRSYWVGFSSRGLSRSEEQRRLSRLKAAFDRAKRGRAPTWFGYISPETALFIKDAIEELAKQWWNYGTMSPSAFREESVHLNPMLLYSPNALLVLSLSLIPLSGFLLSTSLIPIAGESVSCKRKVASLSLSKSLVAAAQTHFKQWAFAFRRATMNRLVIRIVCADALAFCSTLRNYQSSTPAGARSMNLFSDGNTYSRLELHRSDYGHYEKAAPVTFDIIETSNIVDYLGPINVIVTASSLLKYHDSSCLYTETFGQLDSNFTDRLSGVFGMDVRTMSLLLGLVLPDLFTNATDKAEDEFFMENIRQVQETLLRCSRLRWKRLHGCHSSDIPSIQIEANALAKLLAQMHETMLTPRTRYSKLLELYPTSGFHDGSTMYNLASFALFLFHLQATVTTDWAQCIKYLYENHLSLDSFALTMQDLLINMHLCGVDNGIFQKPSPADVSDAILAPILSVFEEIPDQLCITIRVTRERLEVFIRGLMRCEAIFCRLEGGDPGEKAWAHTFSSLQVVFGEWHEQTNEDSYPFFEEDYYGLIGSADMFVSFMVPTWILLSSKRSVPVVKCGIINSKSENERLLKDLGPDLCLARYKMISGNVLVTKFIPGMPALPTFVRQNKPSSATTIVRLTDDASKVDTLTRRATLESQAAKNKLADRSSTVEVEFKTPFTAVISIVSKQCHQESLKLELTFPVPVSSNCIVRIGRKSSYIEIEAPVFDPLVDNSSSLFLYPIFITKDQCDLIVPTLWASTRIDLSVMPPIDLSDKHEIDWLINHVSLMFSIRERRIRELQRVHTDVRTNLKDQLLSLLMRYMGLQGKLADIFAISTNAGMKMLIIPSCIRLDMVNHTLVLDAVMVPITKAALGDGRVMKLLKDLPNYNNFGQLNVNEADYCAWNAMMPALAERCRTATAYQHVSCCKYAHAGEVSRCEEGESPICSCGVGKFPELYLKVKCDPAMKSGLDYLISCYATRVAIAPIFVVPFIEECFIKDFTRRDLGDWAILRRAEDNCPRCKIPSTTGPIFVMEYAHCRNCGRNQREVVQRGGKGLLRCSKCKINTYCSIECQKSDWKKHKQACFLQSG